MKKRSIGRIPIDAKTGKDARPKKRPDFRMGVCIGFSDRQLRIAQWRCNHCGSRWESGCIENRYIGDRDWCPRCQKQKSGGIPAH